jgi:hypothetical protein
LAEQLVHDPRGLLQNAANLPSFLLAFLAPPYGQLAHVLVKLRLLDV